MVYLTGSNTLSVAGDVSASVNMSASAFFGDGSNLSGITTGPAGSDTQVQYNDGGTLAGSSNLTFDDTRLTVTGDLTASVNVSASAFYGDGSNLTGITSGGSANAQGPVGALQFHTGSNGLSGSANVLYNYTTDVLTLNTGLIHNRTGVASTYTASVTDYILGVTAVPVTILMDATSFSEGQVAVVKDESGNASSSDPITLNASASQTMDGLGSVEIESAYGALFVYSNGSNWFIY